MNDKEAKFRKTVDSDLSKIYYRSWVVLVNNMHQTQTNECFTRNERTIHERTIWKTANERTHDTRNERTIHETNARYMNERIIGA
jgi:hypothetical protein